MVAHISQISKSETYLLAQVAKAQAAHGRGVTAFEVARVMAGGRADLKRQRPDGRWTRLVPYRILDSLEGLFEQCLLDRKLRTVGDARFNRQTPFFRVSEMGRAMALAQLRIARPVISDNGPGTTLVPVEEGAAEERTDGGTPLKKRERQVLECLQGSDEPLSMRAIGGRVGCSWKTVSRALGGLEERGLVTWRLAEPDGAGQPPKLFSTTGGEA